jgi:hypothetical protein
MIDTNDARERELTRIREEIIRTTKEIIRLARKETHQVRGRRTPGHLSSRRNCG